MDLARISAYLLIGGFLLLIIGAVTGPPGVYQQAELADRLKIIDEYESRWKSSNLLSVVAILLTSAGFVTLSISLWKNQNQMMLFLAGAASVIAGISIAIETYKRAMDPAAALAGNSTLFMIGLWSMMLSIFSLRLSSAPGWLSGLVGLTF